MYNNLLKNYFPRPPAPCYFQ